MTSKFPPLFLLFLFALANSCATFFSQKKGEQGINSYTAEAKTHNSKNSQRYGGQSQSNGAMGEKEKNLKEYVWVSENQGRSMEVLFICNDDNQMDISIKDPDQMDFVKGHPAYIRMAVAYSPIIGPENDIRLIHRGGVFLKEAKILKMGRKNIQPFLENLRILHLKDIENKKMIREEYDRATSRCETFKGENKDICYRTLTTGPYMVSSYPVITLNVISNVIPPKKARPLRFLTGFNSEQLFQNLKKLSCYKAVNE